MFETTSFAKNSGSGRRQKEKNIDMWTHRQDLHSTHSNCGSILVCRQCFCFMDIHSNMTSGFHRELVVMLKLVEQVALGVTMYKTDIEIIYLASPFGLLLVRL